MERVTFRHLRGARAGQVDGYPLDQLRSLGFGRDPACGVRFDPVRDDLVGRHHARVERDDAEAYAFTLTDLDSRNGTFLNGFRVVGTVPLNPGDVIELGPGGPELEFGIEPLPPQFVRVTRAAQGEARPAVETTKAVWAAPAAAPPPTSGYLANRVLAAGVLAGLVLLLYLALRA